MEHYTALLFIHDAVTRYPSKKRVLLLCAAVAMLNKARFSWLVDVMKIFHILARVLYILRVWPPDHCQSCMISTQIQPQVVLSEARNEINRTFS